MVDQKHPQYTFTKDSVFYYSRRVPSDLKHHYNSSRIAYSLRTTSARRALVSSKALTAKLDDYWLGLRLKQTDVPAAHLLKSQATQGLLSTLPDINEALELYLSTKGHDKGKLFFSHTRRAIGYVVSALGARSLDQYSGADAAKFRDWLKDKGLKTTSIQRNFSIVKAVLNLTINELGLQCHNAFSGVYLAPNQSHDKRRPVSRDNLQRLQTVCLGLDDDIRHLVALISDTGLRLSEAAGLMIEDIKLDHLYPHVIIRPHPHRSLKTSSSQRVVPLVGMSLWAAKRVFDSSSSAYCFPRYASADQTNSNSASAAINKWLKTVAGKDAVIHGLRHSFRDRLRAVNTPTEVIDQLGGWSLKTVGQSYGDGYPLDVLSDWMQNIVTTEHCVNISKQRIQ